MGRKPSSYILQICNDLLLCTPRACDITLECHTNTFKFSYIFLNINISKTDTDLTDANFRFLWEKPKKCVCHGRYLHRNNFKFVDISQAIFDHDDHIWQWNENDLTIIENSLPISVISPIQLNRWRDP